jgi:AcrR family transcriptional regulator
MLAEDNSPRRRARPKERKQQILASAAELFVQQGFPNVTMSTIAESVDITAGALYRHYPNKAELLAFAIRQSLDSFPKIDPEASLDDALALACEVAVRHRELGPLWSRQLRYLPEDTQSELRGRLKDMNHAYVELIQRSRPALSRDQARLLAWSVQGVLSSPGNHSVVLPAAEFADLLESACRSLCDIDLAGTAITAPGSVAPLLEPASRRELLLQKAIRLFGAKGVHATSMEDIGAAAGVTGPSLYTHFAGKEDILAAALDRATQALWLDLGEALHHHDDAQDALRAVVGGYVRMTLGWLQLTSLVLVEFGDNRASRAQQREYVGEWVALIQACRPEVEQAQARILTHAALAVIHDISRTPGVADSGSLQADLTAMALAVLGCTK